MKHLFAICTAAVIALSGYAQDTEISDVKLDNTISVQGNKLVLNGGGLREKLWIDLYVGALYLTNKSSDAAKVMAADEPMNIRLHIVSGLITSEKMIDAVDEGFTKAAGDKRSSLEPRISEFKNAFMEEITEGDVYDIAWLPGTGTVISKNGKSVSTIEGLDFKAALFGIWFCDDPADDDLKEGMLGLD